MTTIKDIARDTGLSPSTVSIVLKGNGDARKITKVTQNKVWEAAKRLGYKPNLQARILRGGEGGRLVITLFWASDIRIHMLSRFLVGLQSALIETGYPCDLQVKPYLNDHLSEVLTTDAMLSCSGIILCNPSKEDMDYLEALSPLVPVVLYNRYSPRYPTVNMDDATIGKLPAKVFAGHKKRRPALLKAPATFEGMNIRTSSFESRSLQLGMEPPCTFTVEDSMRGGYQGALKLTGFSTLPDCLLCTSDNIAIGALKAFHEKGIRIPEDLELISVGNGNPDQEEYAIPSLSVVSLPMEEMAACCLKTLYEMLTGQKEAAKETAFPIRYVARQSCPD